MKAMKSWFGIDGVLEPITYDGPSYFRFPLELAEWAISQFSAPGQWVFDPFCGFGTTLVAAQRLGRYAIGFEKDAQRGSFAASRVMPPSRVIVTDIRQLAHHSFPPCHLLFTSPPYHTFREWNEEGVRQYYADFHAIFQSFAPVLHSGAKLVVEMSNVRGAHGVRTVAWDAAKTLSALFRFEGEIVRCNTGSEPAGPGYDHSYLLVFTNA